MTEAMYRLTPEAVVWATEGDETLALDLGSGGYLGVNSSGTLLWSELERGATEAQLAARLRDVYGVDEQRATEDVRAFLAVCRERGFLAG